MALNAAREAWDGRPLFLYGFDELLPTQLDFVESLVRHTDTELTVAVTYEPGRAALAGSATTVELLKPLGPRAPHARAPVASTTPRAPAAPCTTSSAGCSSRRAAASRPTAPCACSKRAASAPRPSSSARRCLELLRDGMAPEDIAVLVRGGPASELFAQVFDTYGIPVAHERRTPFGETRLGAGLLAFARAARPGGTAQDVVTWLRTPGKLAAAPIVLPEEDEPRAGGAGPDTPSALDGPPRPATPLAAPTPRADFEAPGAPQSALFAPADPPAAGDARADLAEPGDSRAGRAAPGGPPADLAAPGDSRAGLAAPGDVPAGPVTPDAAAAGDPFAGDDYEFPPFDESLAPESASAPAEAFGAPEDDVPRPRALVPPGDLPWSGEFVRPARVVPPGESGATVPPADLVPPGEIAARRLPPVPSTPDLADRLEVAVRRAEARTAREARFHWERLGGRELSELDALADAEIDRGPARSCSSPRPTRSGPRRTCARRTC